MCTAGRCEALNCRKRKHSGTKHLHLFRSDAQTYSSICERYSVDVWMELITIYHPQLLKIDHFAEFESHLSSENFKAFINFTARTHGMSQVC